MWKNKKLKKLLKNKLVWLFVFLFLLHSLLRLYDYEHKNPFGWDQVDNAWAAKNILVNHEFPLRGMQAKLNSGIYIGPYYYYLITPVYFLTNLDPAASAIIAWLTSIITFLTLFYVTKKVFSMEVAYISIILYTVSSYMFIFERVQWPVNFIMPVSLLIFYSIYKIITGNEKYILLLAFGLGFSLHIHFTSIFYFIISLCCVPFFPRTKKALHYILYSLPVGLFFFLPLMISFLTTKSGGSMSTYISTYYHGLHLTRVLQVADLALVEFDHILKVKELSFLKFILPILFGFLYYKKTDKKRAHIVLYLMGIWFLVPWIVFSTYKGEISDYYFLSTAPLVFIIFAYFLSLLFKSNVVIAKLIALTLISIFFWINLNIFPKFHDEGSLSRRREALNTVLKRQGTIIFYPNYSEAYLYYLYLRQTGQDNVIKTYFD